MKLYCLAILTVFALVAARASDAQNAPVLSHCDSLRHDGVANADNGDSKIGYMMLQQFIAECAAGIHHPSYGWLPLFMKIGGAVSGYASNEPGAFSGFQDWLKAVLYTNRDSDYYCADVFEILGTFVDSSGFATYESQTEAMATMRYILESHKCPSLENDITFLYQNAAISRYKHWREEVYDKGIDTIANPYDSTLPSIDDIGLGILRGPTQRVSSSTNQSGPSLLTVSALNNPFNRDLDLTVDMGREALVTVEMFDLLGNAVPLTGMKYMLKESGPQRITVPVGSLAAGTYYLRVSTDWGDVKTVKVVKE